MKRQVQRFGVLALCAGLLWLTVDWAAALALLRAADLRLLAGAVMLLVLQTLLSAERWRLTAGQLGIRLARGHALREYFLAQVVNQSLPGGVLGDANRALRSKTQRGLAMAAKAVLFERIAGQLGLIGLFALGLGISLAMPGLQPGPERFAPLAALSLGALMGIGIALWVLRRRYGVGGDPARGISAEFHAAVFARAVWPQQMALSLGTALCNVAAFACCIWAIGTDLSALAALTLIPLILFAMVLPLSIGGWGLREGTAAALFPLWGAAAEAGLAASVAFGVAILASLAPVLFFGWPAPKRRARQDGDLP